MNENTISSFLMQNSKFFAPTHQAEIKQLLAKVAESKIPAIQTVSFMNPM